MGSRLEYGSITSTKSCSKKYPAIIKLNHGMFYRQTVIIGFVFMLLLSCKFACNFVSSKILFSLKHAYNCGTIIFLRQRHC